MDITHCVPSICVRNNNNTSADRDAHTGVYTLMNLAHTRIHPVFMFFVSRQCCLDSFQPQVLIVRTVTPEQAALIIQGSRGLKKTASTAQVSAPFRQERTSVQTTTTTWFSKMCLLLDTPCGRRSVGALSLLPLGSLLDSTKNCQSDMLWVFGFCHLKLYMLALVGRPSLHSYDACMVYRIQGASRNCRQKHGKTSFSPQKVFLFSRNPQKRFWSLVFWYLWIGRAKNPGPGSSHRFVVEVFNVGGWLTQDDIALSAGLDFWRLLSIV